MRNKILELIKEYPYKVGHLIGFEDLTTIHNDWIKEFLFGENDYTLQAHRGSYKTSCLIVALALLVILKPNESILFLRKTEADAIEVLRAVAKALKTSIFQEFVRVLYNIELNIIKDTNSEIDTNLNTSFRGSSQLIGLGSTSSLTGKHYERIYTDDIVNLKDRVSKAERERTKLVYQELQNLKNRGGKIVNTGTIWHKEDAFTIMPKAKVFDCYSTGLMTKEQIAGIRQLMTAYLFSANYELKHIASENALFTNPQFTKETEEIYNGISHIDASYGGETTNDTSAFTILKQQKDGSFIGFGKVWDKHIDKCLSEIYLLHEQYKAGTIALETNADKGYLARDIAKAGKPVSTYHEKQNKFIKISTFLRANWHKIKWLEDTDNNYLNQILDFQEGQEPDDCPDSAASLLRMLTKHTQVKGLRPF